MTDDLSIAPIPHPTLRQVPPSSLIPNPHNPRVLFDELPLQTLEDSIRKVGVLVPLTVYQATGSQKFTILDGQRRWVCVQRIGLPFVPINEVAEPNVAQNIVTMFQIHKLRKDWELMPTALKLGVLMDELKETGDKALASLTGLDVAVVTRCKKLLWFPKQYHEMMMYADPEDRIKADFFIELYPILTDRLISRADWFERDKTIEIFLRKYQEKLSGFKAITDFRKIKQHITAARAAGRDDEILLLFKDFLTSDAMEISDLEIDTARYHRQASGLVRAIGRIRQEIEGLDVEGFIGEEDLWEEIEKIVSIMRSKLREADRRSLDD
jgi:ParB/RepB/Spo0J family partition protein